MDNLKKVKQGEFVYQKMKSWGWTQRNLAGFLNCSESLISAYFAGKKHIGTEKAKAISSEFNIPLEYIL